MSELRLQLYSPEDRVIGQGEIGTNVYFIVEGEAEVILERHVSLSKIRHVLEDTYQLKHHEVKKYASEPDRNEYSKINEVSAEDKSRSDISAISEQKPQEKTSTLHEADKLVIKTLGKGQYFGEVAAITGHKHTATVRVKKCA